MNGTVTFEIGGEQVRKRDSPPPPLRASCPQVVDVEGGTMKVRDVMTRDVQILNPNQTIREAARIMGEMDVGALPVGENDRLAGMITDRDIAVRAVAEGRAPDTHVADVMSRELLYCFDDEELDDAARNMGKMKVRRLPVVNRDKRLVGIISLGDLARNEEPTTVGRTVSRVSEPGGKHSQAGAH
jgi:CBS domain-containing protein